ncbi:flagellar hook-associated protein FlgK [Endozoicomonas ascidiicola]|uniref:flagellar hook-associated protein FlgK n=1 Tax=Endozoicomonas ascidiicola TaxID=1698521 RepID=UPI000832934C|nr:flagellar hook-associated protein FlgK [Endozoicomonas ascidiicola]
MSMINTGMSGMFAAQTALNVASSNISASTIPGYTRQQVNLATNMHGGVYVSDVRRMTDSFLTDQVRDTSTAYGYSTAYYSHANQLETLVTSDGSSLSPALTGMFGALNSATSDPASDAARQTVLAQASDLASRFNTLHGSLQKQSELANDQLGVMVDDVNSLLSDIAEINDSIMASQTGSGVPNGLLDQRDQAMQKLSELMDVTVDTRPDGTVDIFLPQGDPLVMRGKANQVSLNPGDPDSDRMTLSLVTDTAEKPLKTIGGSIQGVLDFQSDVIDPAMRELGRMAVVISDAMNTQLGAGVDLNNKPGSDLFSNINSIEAMRERVEASRENTGSGVLEVEISDSSKLSADDYSLEITADGQYILTSAGKVVSKGDQRLLTTDKGVTVDGITIKVGEGELKPGDSFGIEPTAGFSGSMDMVMESPDDLAFSGAYDTPGDNSNLLELAKLEKAHLIEGNKTLGDSWNLLVTDVGNTTAQAEGSYNATKVLHEEASSALSSVAGVNMDEEAGNLLIYQQAYQANAKVIATAQQLLDTVLNL